MKYLTSLHMNSLDAEVYNCLKMKTSDSLLEVSKTEADDVHSLIAYFARPGDHVSQKKMHTDYGNYLARFSVEKQKPLSKKGPKNSNLSLQIVPYFPSLPCLISKFTQCTAF
jgi:hypothetical protein